MTKHRKLILEIIRASKEHLTAEEIYMQAKQVQSSIAVGTVYRNLGLLTKAGEIRKLVMTNGPDRYDKSLIPHEHLSCQYCGRVSDIAVFDLKNYLEMQTGIEILGYDLNIRYMCEQCKK